MSFSDPTFADSYLITRILMCVLGVITREAIRPLCAFRGRDSKLAVYVYLETGPNTGTFHLRGELGRGDNPDSFERQMSSQGLRVMFTDEVVTEGVRTLDRGQQEVDGTALGLPAPERTEADDAGDEDMENENRETRRRGNK